MELFKKLGPRVILVEYRGRLTGLVTVKDCLKYQFQAEAHENPREQPGVKEGQEKLWQIIRDVAGWIGNQLGRVSGGRIRVEQGAALQSPVPQRNRDLDEPGVVGDRDEHSLELEDR